MSASMIFDDSNDAGAVVYARFVLPNLYSDELPLNAAAQFAVKRAAFKIVEDMYVQSYNNGIDALLALRPADADVALPRDRCVHYLIDEIKNVIEVVRHLSEQSRYQHSMFIFLPYVRQLRQLNQHFVHDHCCGVVVRSNAAALDAFVAAGEKYLHVIRTMNERMHVINVFTEPRIYQCNICQDASLQENFLKPNECCGYNICNMCYANLWKFCNMYPVCPVCKTSFKSSKQIVEND
ncbi:ie0 [Peridroma alphabaculovirus]|uniref:Ie0 n=1 Tax=Peridroma alphabaculovirus TaxID=1346829 RepID=A0A068LMY5_9ABAC|nr:ie0 [Peridroma alphabaculovirus]AIE47861.1 ie0 [Peridroma alphabaculovirus]